MPCTSLPLYKKETASHPAAVQTVQQEPESPVPAQLLAAPSTVEDEVTVATSALHLAADSFFDEGIYSESEDSEEEDLFI